MRGPATLSPVQRCVAHHFPIDQSEKGQNPVVVQLVRPSLNGLRVRDIISKKQAVFLRDPLEELEKGALVFFDHEPEEHLSAIVEFFTLRIMLTHLEHLQYLEHLEHIVSPPSAGGHDRHQHQSFPSDTLTSR